MGVRAGCLRRTKNPGRFQVLTGGNLPRGIMNTTTSNNNGSASMAFVEVQLIEWQWKTAAMERMAIEVARIALRLPEFAADDLPADLDHGGHGIAGSIFDRLASNGIITKCGVWAGVDFLAKSRTSRADGRHSARIPVWKLADRAKAESFLRAKHTNKESEAGVRLQPELIPA